MADDTADDTRLLAALAVIQSRGAIGERSLVDAVAHADRFVSLIPRPSRSVVDLGSGGGLPALVVAWRRPELHTTMVERRATRADLLQRAITAMGIGARATVITDDVAAVCRRHSRVFDVVTARSFADPATTVGFVDELLNDEGVALISEPPNDRTEVWRAALLGSVSLYDGGVEQGIRIVRRGPSGTNCST